MASHHNVTIVLPGEWSHQIRDSIRIRISAHVEYTWMVSWIYEFNKLGRDPAGQE